VFRSFQVKLVVFFAGLLALVQVVTFLAVNTATSKNVIAQTKDQLQYANRIFTKQISQRGELLAEKARILAADFGSREALTSDDPETVKSALYNLGARVESDRTLLVSLDHTITIDSGANKKSPQLFPFPDLLTKAENNGSYSQIWCFRKIHLSDVLVEFACC